jgi:CheY-like chemotaxis protein
MPVTSVYAPSADDDSNGHSDGLNILIAEDNASGAESLALILEHAGHRVRVVYNGLAAVAAAAIDPPDVLLTDIGLPGLDGWEVARRVRATLGQRACLLVAVTGNDQPEDRRRSRMAGIDKHWTKPLLPNALLALLDRYHPSGA